MLHLREVTYSASCVQRDRGRFVVDLDEPNSVDEGRVQEGVETLDVVSEACTDAHTST